MIPDTVLLLLHAARAADLLREAENHRVVRSLPRGRRATRQRVPLRRAAAVFGRPSRRAVA
jgi:hypothetical protein